MSGEQPKSKKEPGRGKFAGRRTKPLPDHLIYTVCERFLLKTEDPATGERWTAKALAEWLTAKNYPTTREGIFPIVRQAIGKGFVELRPPRVKSLFDELANRFPNLPPTTRILDVRPEDAMRNITSTAATRLLSLIRDVGKRKGAFPTPNGKDAKTPRVHIGFGAGGTTHAVATRLALLMANESNMPLMTLHALTSGFNIHDPLSAPASFFPAFHALNHPIEYVGLFAPAVVKTRQWASVCKLPDVADCFREAKKIDIVVTSLAQAGDEHGLLNRFLQHYGGDPQKLVAKDHVGDVQFQPFSATGPIQVDTGIRAVVLFDLTELVQLTKTNNKHVMLLAGPCITCGATKSRALKPLLAEESLRVCNHLIMDAQTAQELL